MFVSAGSTGPAIAVLDSAPPSWIVCPASEHRREPGPTPQEMSVRIKAYTPRLQQ